MHRACSKVLGRGREARREALLPRVALRQLAPGVLWCDVCVKYAQADPEWCVLAAPLSCGPASVSSVPCPAVTALCRPMGDPAAPVAAALR